MGVDVPMRITECELCRPYHLSHIKPKRASNDQESLERAIGKAELLAIMPHLPLPPHREHSHADAEDAEWTDRRDERSIQRTCAKPANQRESRGQCARRGFA